MDWFLHNPIGDMPGPAFLGLYAFVIVGTIFICAWKLFTLDSTRSLSLPQVPTELDPYLVAYLRGGENEVVRLVILDLIQRGYLAAKEDEKKIGRARNHPEARHLTKLEQVVFDWFESDTSPAEVFSSSSLAAHVLEHCRDYGLQMRNEKLLLPEEVGQSARKIGWIGALVILGVGGYKLIVALTKGYTNVGFLLLMGAGAVILLLGICKQAQPRLSSRGKGYVKRVQLALAKLKQRAADIASETTNESLLLLVSVFGIGVLAGTTYDYYPKIFKRASKTSDDGGTWWGSSSSCGSSCSSGSVTSCGSSCGGGGGCGGCGGGD